MSDRPSTNTEGRERMIRISVSLPEREFAVLESISSRYAESSGIKVELRNREPEEPGQGLMTDLTAGDRPDIVMTDGNRVLELASGGYLLPVDIYQSVPGDTPLPRLLSQVQWNGYGWGVPLDIDPMVIVYAPERLRELGLGGPPGSREEWQQLLAAAGKQGKYMLSIDPRSPYGMGALLESLGSGLAEADPELLEWIRGARSRMYYSASDRPELWERLHTGEVAAAIVPLSAWSGHSSSGLAASALSAGSAPEALQSRCFALSAQSSSPEEAVAWVTHMTSAAVQREWGEQTGRLPALDEMYRRPQLDASGMSPIQPSQLLEEAALPQTAGLHWSRLAAAVTAFLTGKLDTAGYGKEAGLWTHERVAQPASSF